MNQSSRLIRRALERLSTGQRVNSPRDDVASFSLGTQLDSKIRGLRAGVLNLNQERSLLDTASTSLSVQTEILQRMRELAVQAANEALSDRSGIQAELQDLLSEFQRITAATEFNGQSLLSRGDLSLMNGEVELELPNQNISEVFQRTVGSGSYSASVSFNSDAPSFSASDNVAADLNGDGLTDLAFSDVNGVLRVSINQGDGEFSEAETIEDLTGFYFYDLKAADLNGDGALDLVGHASSSIYLFMNHGDGTFGAAKSIAVSSGGQVSVLVDDVNEDGRMDIISGTRFVEIFLGDANENYTLSQSIEFPSSLWDFQFEDVSGDGEKDIVFIDYESNSVRYLAGQGSGLFATSSTNLVSSPILNFFGSLAFGDLDGDGDRDMVVGEHADNTAFPSGYTRVYLSSGSGTFTIASSLYTNGFGAIQDVEFGDLNGDGILDLLTAGGGGGLHYFIGQGNGSFSSATTISADSITRASLTDLSQDGVLDILLLNNTDTRAEIYFQNTKQQSGLSKFSVNTAQEARELMEILDQALEAQLTHQVELGVLSQRLERRVTWLQEQESVSVEARSLLLDADIAIETSELVRSQILQQAQIAALSQNQLQASLVLNLLSMDR